MGTSAPQPIPSAVRGANIRPEQRARTGGRLGGSRTLLAFGIGFAAIIGIAVAIVAVVARSIGPMCQPYHPCRPISSPTPLVNQTLWRSSQFGFTLEYPADQFQVAESDGAHLILAEPLADGSEAGIIIRGMPATSPAKAITTELGNISG